jgi:hypothetical protein
VRRRALSHVTLAGSRDYESRDYESRDYESRDYESRDYESRDYESRDYESRTKQHHHSATHISMQSQGSPAPHTKQCVTPHRTAHTRCAARELVHYIHALIPRTTPAHLTRAPLHPCCAVHPRTTPAHYTRALRPRTTSAQSTRALRLRTTPAHYTCSSTTRRAWSCGPRLSCAGPVRSLKRRGWSGRMRDEPAPHVPGDPQDVHVDYSVKGDVTDCHVAILLNGVVLTALPVRRPRLDCGH